MVRSSVQATPKQARDPKRKTSRHLDDESGKVRRRVPAKAEAEAARTVSQRRKKTPSDVDPENSAERSIGVTITI
jgi:hypothetical protein